MATWNSTPTTRNGSYGDIPSEPGKGTSTVTTGTSSFFFYSNNPETIGSAHTCDSGKFLNQGTVTGNGQLYVWHRNQSGGSVTGAILVYNPNSYKITVKATNYGQTLGKSTDSSDGWYKYYTTTTTKILTLNGGAYGYLFSQSVSNNTNWGFIARISIVRDGTTTSASAGFTDLAYKSAANAHNGTLPSALDTSGRVRGVGKGYYTYLRFATLNVPGTPLGAGFKIAALSSVFNGGELISLTGPSNSGSGKNDGGYGQQFEITLPVKNGTTTKGFFDIFVGSNGGQYFPFVNFGNSYYYPASGLGQGGWIYKGVIRTIELAPNATETVTFAITVPAGTDTPLMVGARKV